MISVLNHLLLSSGNRSVQYFLLIPVFVFLFSCRASKTGKTDPEVVEIVGPDRPVKPELPEVKDDTAILPIDVIDPEDLADLSDKAFNIVLMLPFQLDDYQPGVQDPATADISRSTSMAVEFYQGFRYVMEQLAPRGFNAEVHVFDTRNDPNTTKRILNGPDFPEADLIVGPIFNKNLRVAADYCKENQIPMISPLSSSSSITRDNPYYYTANGTSHAHYEALAHHIHEFYPGDTVHIIHNGTASEREVIDMFNKIRLAEFDSSANPVLEIEMTTDANTFDLKSEFDSLETHIVFIPSYDEIFSNYALNQLAQIKTYYPSIVFGMPTWIRFNNVNFDYFEWLQVHVSESAWIDEDSPGIHAARRDLSLEYGIDPSEYTFHGYDLAHYVITFLSDRPGTRRQRERFFTISDPLVGVQSGFRFTPRYLPGHEGNDEKVDYWDNQYIHILKFENYRYNKVDR